MSSSHNNDMLTFNPLTSLNALAKTADDQQIKLFIKQNELDLDVRDLRQNTLLHWCSFEGKQQYCEMLLERHVNVNAANCAGDRPIHVACKSGNEDVVETLIRYGADVNIENEHGNTALHYACFFRYLKIIDTLIDAGANITVTNNFYKVPLDFAGNHIYSHVIQRVKGSAAAKGGSTQSLRSDNLGSLSNLQNKDTFAEIDINKRFQNLDIQEIEDWVQISGTITKTLHPKSMYRRDHVIVNGTSLAARMYLQPISEVGLQLLREEVEAMRQLNSTHLLPVCAVLNGTLFGVLYPYIKCISISDRIKAKPSLSAKSNIIVALNVVKGLMYLATKEIYHLNLRSSNILLMEDLTVKLTDFGFKSSPMAETFPPQKQIIDPTWVAPEILYDNIVENLMAIDSYSFGVLLNSLFVREDPFPEARDNPMALGFKIVYNRERPKMTEDVPEPLIPLIKACWANDPFDRPTLKSSLEILSAVLEAISV